MCYVTYCQGDRDWRQIMEDNSLFIGIWLLIALVCGVCVFHFGCKQMRNENPSGLTLADYEAINNARAGVVVDKEVKRVTRESEPRYILVLEFTYTVDDDIRTGTKEQVVDKETYMATNLNDWFDIITFTATSTDAQ